MADTEMQKAQAASQAGAELQEKGKDVSQLLSAFGGFNAIRGFMPDADNMNPARKAAKDVFLSDKRFKEKREGLKKDIKRWLELLEDTSLETASNFADACKQDEVMLPRIWSAAIVSSTLSSRPAEQTR